MIPDQLPVELSKEKVPQPLSGPVQLPDLHSYNSSVPRVSRASMISYTFCLVSFVTFIFVPQPSSSTPTALTTPDPFSSSFSSPPQANNNLNDTVNRKILGTRHPRSNLKVHMTKD